MPVSLTDWSPTIRLAGATIAGALTDTGAGSAVAIDELVFTWGREQILSASDGDSLSLSLLVRDPWWLTRMGTLAAALVSLTLTPPAGDLTYGPMAALWAQPVFTGRVVPESVELRPANRRGDGWIVTVAAVDLRAWSGTIVVGQPAWPAETLALRLGRIDTLARSVAGFGVSTAIPALGATPVMNALDVDRKPLADMLDDLSSSLGLTWVWGTPGFDQVPVLQLGALADDTDTITQVWQAGVGEAGGGPVSPMRITLPGNVIAGGADAAQHSVGSINEVRVNYTNATPAAKTYIAADLPSQATVGIRSMSVDSQVRDLSAATDVGDRLLRIARRLARYRHPPVSWDAHYPAARPTVTANALDANARALSLTGGMITGYFSALPIVYVAGSVYNRIPELLTGLGSAVPWWQVIGGGVSYRRGRLAGELVLSPRYFIAPPTEPTWDTLTGAGTTRTWTDLAASMVDRSVTWTDLPAFATT